MTKANRCWLLQEFAAHPAGLSSITLGKKSGRVMATGGEDGVVNLWPVGNPSYLMKFTGHSSAVEALCFNGTEESVCAGSRSGQLRIWEIAEGKIRRNLTGHKAAVSCIDFHPYGDFLASGSLDHKLKMWDIRRKGCINTFTGHNGAINALQFSPDGRWLTSCSDDCTCKIWDLSAGKMIHQFRDHTAAVMCFQFHPNELFMATGGKDRTIKFYDVEQFRLVSSSRPQANAVLKVVFSETGHCVFSVSQDMCQVHVWEPEHSTTDSIAVKWGRPVDTVISNKQLISATFQKNIVTNYVVDLNKTNSSPYELPNKLEPFQPPATVSTSHVTERPRPTTTHEPPPPRLFGARQKNSNDQTPAQFQINTNNNFPSSSHENNKPEEIFQPKKTLSRSPSESKPSSLPLQEQKCRKVVPSPFPYQATNILPHLSPDPVPAVQDHPVKPEQDPTPMKPPSQILSKNETPDNYNAGEIGQLVPTKDENIPEKLENNNPIHDNVSQLRNISTLSLNESRMSTIVPSQREDPVGLDINAFLPVETDHSVEKENEKYTDEKAVNLIRKGSQTMRSVLSSRYKNLEIVRALWSTGDVMTAMNTALRMKDQALLVDLLSVLNLKSSLWTLDLSQIMLPEICELLKSKYETHITASCAALKILLRNFGPVIKSNVTAPPTSVVDLSREERYKKCFSCHKSLFQIRTIIEEYLQQPGKTNSHFRELNLLLSTLD